MIVDSNSQLMAQLRASAPVASTTTVVVAPSVPTVAVENNSGKALPTLVEAAVKGTIMTTATVTPATSQDVADIRREVAQAEADVRYNMAQQISDVRRETAKEASDITDTVKTSGWANSDRTGTEADRVVAQDTAYFIAAQSQNFSNATALAALKASTDASFAQTLAAIQLSSATTTAAAQLAGEKTAAAAALGQALIGQQIVADGNATRALLNSSKIDDLNRILIERNAKIVEAHGDARYAALVGQLNLVHSQVQDTKAGMVNFGTMGASTQTSSNQVA